MQRFARANMILGIVCITAALLTALVWVPMDTTTGMIEKVRRQVTVGDALAPTIAAGFILLGGLIVAFLDRAETASGLIARNLRFLVLLLGILAVAFAIMRWLGPAVAWALTEDGYRNLRDTAPWKYIGFLIGGAGLIAGLITLVEGRLTLRAIAIGLAAALALILVYDLPFDDLLLPPNGDV